MNIKETSVGATSSAAARQILALPAAPTPDLLPETLPQIRRQTYEDFEPSIERAIRNAGVEVSEIEISGVPCLEVHPSDRRVDWPILYAYGGGYITGSPREDLIVAAPLAARSGAKVVMPHYRLAPEYPWPAAPDDGFAVYHALATRPFALAGESAGGNLAMVCLLRAQSAGLRLPGATALLSPWCDLTPESEANNPNEGMDPTLSRAFVEAAARHYGGGNDLTEPDISPVYGQWRQGLPPTIITTGTRDHLLGQAARAGRVLRQAGAMVDIRIWDDLWHVFEFDDRLPEAALSICEIADFLVRHMSLSGHDE